MACVRIQRAEGERMKAILMSIQPKWCELIANKTKAIEVRKTAPKEVPFKVYMYCTKGKSYLYKNPNNGELFLDSNGGYRGGDYEDRYLTGKVIGEFICDKVDFVKYEGSRYIINNDLVYTNGIAAKSCLGYSDMYKYLRNKNGFALHISDLKIYDKPKKLSEFRPWCKKSRMTEDNLEMCCKCNNAFFDEGGVFYDCGLRQAPQSWQYVEELQ